MGALAGPSPIAKNGQVVVPKSVLRALGWDPEHQALTVMFSVDDEDPEVVSMVPTHVFERRYRRGEGAERLQRLADPRQHDVDQQDQQNGQ
jgi:bifunctional DNA-binding transcriptional regulator/antitoxin component of YhaV-PrlF toxin-antitoxin module